MCGVPVSPRDWRWDNQCSPMAARDCLVVMWGVAASFQPPPAFWQGKGGKEEAAGLGGAWVPTSPCLCSGAGPAAAGAPSPARAAGEGPGSPTCPPRWERARDLCVTMLCWFRCSYLKPDEDKKSKHKTAVKKKTLNPEFNEVGFPQLWFSPRGFSQFSELKGKNPQPQSLGEGLRLEFPVGGKGQQPEEEDGQPQPPPRVPAPAGTRHGFIPALSPLPNRSFAMR